MLLIIIMVVIITIIVMALVVMEKKTYSRKTIWLNPTFNQAVTTSNPKFKHNNRQ